MKAWQLHLFFSFLTPVVHSIAQSSTQDLEDALRNQTERLMMSPEQKDRMEAFDSTVSLLMLVLHQDGSFDLTFDSLPRISIQYPGDSTFRIFSGQLYIDENNYKYYGILQHRADERRPV
ncbi:MAG: hypothetical protein OEQ53_19600, partial [Saprospiraceae bacterium]|nr:hypothetical protein [Saprospiraceae bacterium]